MTPVLFYGVPEGCSFGSIVALEWIGQPYRLCRIPMPALVTSDTYRRINAMGETPALLTEDGRFVSESMAILNHIAVNGIDKGLAFAQRTPGFDRLNQMLAFLNTSFFGAFSPLWYALEHGLADAEASVLRAYGQRQVHKAHSQLEALLGDQAWLLGAHKTLADAYFIGIARWADFHRVIDPRDFPRLHRLRQKLESDPAVRFAHAIEHEHAASSTGGFHGHVSLDAAMGARPV